MDSSIATRLDAHTLHITIVGEFTFVRVPDIERLLDERSPEVQRILVDASRMSNIDSSGMGMLLLMQHVLGTRGALAIAGCHGTALDSIERLQLHKELLLLTPEQCDTWLQGAYE